MKAISLKTNYRMNPLGIDDEKIRFSWICENGILQKSFQIIIWNEANMQIHDSGKVDSNLMHYVYSGEKLQAKHRYFWQVKLWDENNEAVKSDKVFFETGLLQESWKAKWITTGKRAKKDRIPADYFQKTFAIKGKVKKARLYATACGVTF